jgi:sugar O-acyltransferase (sialic acid O-acetyltransferase NeuD family)
MDPSYRYEATDERKPHRIVSLSLCRLSRLESHCGASRTQMSAAGQDLLLIGAGGLAREAAEAVRATNAVRPTWDLLGFVDDDPAKQGRPIADVPVLGPLAAVHEHPGAQLLLCPGRPDNYTVRRFLADRLGVDDERYATVVHPTATVGSTCKLGAGSVLLAHADLTADVVVGRHVVLMPQVVLTHDVRVDDFATLASGVRLGGNCHIGQGAYVGSGACLREGITVGHSAMVGMGSVVTRHVPAERMWFGVPARDVAPAPLQARTREVA